MRGAARTRPFVDTDDLVETTARDRRSPRSSRRKGEPAFRAPSASAVADAVRVAEPLVIACGGGAVLDPENRRTLRDAGVVVWLRAAPSVLGDRVRRRPERPSAARAGRRCHRRRDARAPRGAARESLYEAAAHVVVDTDGRTVDEVADAVVDAFEDAESRDERRARRTSPRRTTSWSRRARCATAAAMLAGIRRVAIVSQAADRRPVPRRAAVGARRASPRSSSWATARRRRRSAPSRISAGGSRRGACCAAMRWSRSAAASSATPPGSPRRRTTAGIAVLQVPTTLLAMVDAAIGGKTAVNLPEGKNLVGAFHQPVGVLADTDTLATLPEPEYRSGLGEVAKYALLGDVVADPSGLVELLRLHTTEVLGAGPGGARRPRDPLRADQGGRRRPRPGGAHRAARHPQPRPHVRARARDRRRLRPDPRRGRRDRAGVRRCARRRVRAGGSRRRRPLPGGARRRSA